MLLRKTINSCCALSRSREAFNEAAACCCGRPLPGGKHARTKTRPSMRPQRVAAEDRLGARRQNRHAGHAPSMRPQRVAAEDLFGRVGADERSRRPSMRPQRVAAEDPSMTRWISRSAWRACAFNEAAACCCGRPMTRSSPMLSSTAFNEAAACCCGRPSQCWPEINPPYVPPSMRPQRVAAEDRRRRRSETREETRPFNEAAACCCGRPAHALHQGLTIMHLQ